MNILNNLANSVKKIKSLMEKDPSGVAFSPDRRIHAYCLGTAKSGTHSLAGLFQENYRTAHEPDDKVAINLILGAANGKVNNGEIVKYLRKRDKQLCLELDSSQLNYFFFHIFVEEFANAKFILPIRDCYSWLDSLINHQLARPATSEWYKLRDFRFKRKESKYSEKEQILAEHNLYTLDGYLSYWRTHNMKVSSGIPEDKLLVIRTKDISKESRKIANFLGIPESTLDKSKSHMFKAEGKFNILSRIDRQFLEGKVNAYCKQLMDRFFPEIKSIDDVL